MRLVGTVPLETERLLLRRASIEDAADMYRNWASDPEVARYLTWKAHEHEAETEAHLGELVSKYSDCFSFDWLIVPKGLGKPVGSIGVVQFSEKTSSFDIGFALGRRWWNQGIMTVAVSRVVAFLFKEVGAKRVCAQYDTENHASRAVLGKVGMTYEGTIRQAGVNNRGIIDIGICSILVSEYHQRAQ